VAGVAHELNTPIGNGRMAVSTLKERVVGFRRQLEQGLRRSDLEAFVAQVEVGGDIATRNLERASELLTSFKQVAVDQTSDQRRRFLLREVVDEILLTLQPTFKRTSHEVVCQVPGDIELDSYPGALGQVLTNLIQNAHIHGLDGIERGRIDVVALRQGDEVLLSVADNGRGIPEAHHRHVFDPFYTTKLGHGGSGLGLPIVRNIVSGALGGHIGFRNLDAGGVVFEVSLPLTAPQVRADEVACA
jgi:signal transduction histidine kinase